jgi:hypothetical protein
MVVEMSFFGEQFFTWPPIDDISVYFTIPYLVKVNMNQNQIILVYVSYIK